MPNINSNISVAVLNDTTFVSLTYDTNSGAIQKATATFDVNATPVQMLLRETATGSEQTIIITSKSGGNYPVPNGYALDLTQLALGRVVLIGYQLGFLI